MDLAAQHPAEFLHDRQSEPHAGNIVARRSFELLEHGLPVRRGNARSVSVTRMYQ